VTEEKALLLFGTADEHTEATVVTVAISMCKAQRMFLGLHRFQAIMNTALKTVQMD
jgi:hypothetical protein